MGFWSPNILGSDTALDILAVIEKQLSLKTILNRSGKNYESLSFIEELSQDKIKQIKVYVEKDLPGLIENVIFQFDQEDVNIAKQVIAYVCLAVVANISGEVKKVLIESAVNDEWANSKAENAVKRKMEMYERLNKPQPSKAEQEKWLAEINLEIGGRKAVMELLISTLQNYDGTPIILPDKGLVNTITDAKENGINLINQNLGHGAYTDSNEVNPEGSLTDNLVDKIELDRHQLMVKKLVMTSKVIKAIDELRIELKTEPTDEQISAKTSLTLEEISYYKKIIEEANSN